MNSHPYFPPPDPDWEQVAPAAAGFDPERLGAAVEFAVAGETDWSRDIRTPLMAKMAEPPPHNEIIGPLRARGGPSGLILRAGRLVAAWGDIRRADMTFSASKSYLALCAGLAFDRGLIPDIQAPVRELVDDGGFESPHNRKITWQHLLQQTSEWEGTLWGKPDSIDRNRDVSIQGPQSQKGTPRELQAPGTYFEYNDVRVNRASLALLRVWRRPLAEVLKEYIMDPIGASDTWEWHGYRNSYVTIDGRDMPSVSGGGHWGGGLFISSLDHARVGYLILRNGRWDGKRLLSEQWLRMATSPCEQNPDYGYMFWLNGQRSLISHAPAGSIFMRGAGSNLVWIDPEHDLVCVVRWILKERIDGFCWRVLQALDG